VNDTEVSPDGKTLAFEQRTPLGNYDILTLSLEAPGAPSVLLGSRFDEIQLRFSPVVSRPYGRSNFWPAASSFLQNSSKFCAVWCMRC
jgi:hypothetical protein